MELGLNEDLANSCSSSSTPHTTTVTTTTAATGVYQISSHLYPNPYQQHSSSTPCLTSPNLYQPNYNYTHPKQVNIQNEAIQQHSNPTLPPIQPSLQLHHSNPALTAEHNIGTSNENISWQVVRRNKRKNAAETSPNLKLKLKRFEPYNNPRPVITPSQYEPIAVDEDDDDEEEDPRTETNNTNNQGTNNFQPTQPTIPAPPPVFIHGVMNYQQMRANLSTALQDTDYVTRTLANNTVKINPKTVDAYRALVRHLRSNNVVFHTYQIKQDRAYRVVLRHIHHSIPTSDIKTELEGLGFKIRNIMNITSRTNKSPLNLFFVDLEPASNNKNIFELKNLLNMKIAIEAPRKSTNIVQCTRCQTYGHTKSYCTHPFACVKCAGNHSSSSCTKSRDLPAKCVLCDGPHPANYKGCTVYKELQNMRRNNQHNQPIHNANQASTNTPITRTNITNNTTNNNTNTHNVSQSRTYASMLHGNQHSQNQHQTPPSEQIVLTSFLQEFKAMFSQLISQNTMIIQMLNTVISNIVQK